MTMEIKIMIPQEPKAKVMLWTDISYHDMERLNKIQSIPELQITLCELLEIDVPNPKRGILLDLYVQTVFYCRENNFKPTQTSTLLSILKSIHKINAETVINNIEHCHTYCKELLLCHSVRQPPFSIDLYNSEEVTSIYKYIYNSYMRHYRLYKFVFTPQLKLDLSLTYSDSTDQNVAATSA
ncbi:coiled-coil domain-containing protein 189 [Boleophthalmus pectinirostris]|uniref:coiled-coil domain-containing protein 189 n=1 Tax=Boleophthalmus pectinirostris TaxID=150288 RepID=UPI00242EEBA8|nr:coiled-coil domain-containing protein 189 [Boleophthalmus pectinirostris]